MEITILTFGDVFRLKESEEFVFLSATDQVVYAAKILNNEQTRELYNAAQKRDHKTTVKNQVYFFVVLQTKEFKSRIAHLGKTDSNNIERVSIYMNKVCKLDNNDLLLIKESLLSEETFVPKALKESIEKIEIPE